MSRVVCLYGPPGVGKLTVANELAAITELKVLHSHLTIDLVTAVFEWGSEPWTRMSRTIMELVLAEAGAQGIGVVVTAVFRGLERQTQYHRSLFERLTAAGREIVYVQLTCEPEELFSRVAEESRRAFGKLTDPDAVRKMMEEYDLYAALPLDEHMHLDTTDLSASEAARRIVDHYHLVANGGAGDE